MRKFSEYVLIPNHRSGKDRIFLGILGYHPNSIEDAQELLMLYIEQAQVNFVNQKYIVGENDQYGQRLTIVIEVRGRKLLTGWILDANGTLKLATPFSGFAE
ncbi:MAG: hypothetical protein PUP92_19900 [Rhizonema sp. PD38]|nr:hypothetical protein [Rhizonema sp. PD38]